MKLTYFIFFLLPFFGSCHDMDEGYLMTGGVEYANGDTLIIRKIPDKILDRSRIEKQAPWATDPIDGILGTEPIVFRLHEVRATDGGNARIFTRKDLTVRGLGRMEVQLYPEAPRGTYTVSLEVTAADHIAVLKDIFTFIIE